MNAQIEKELFIKVFNINPLPMALSLDDGKYFDINDAFLSMLKCKKEDVIGKNPTEIGLIVDADVNSLLEQANNNQGSIRDKELIIKDFEGNLHTGIFSAEILRFPNSNLILSVIQDITKIKQIESELQRSEIRFANMFEHHDMVMLLINPKDGRIVRANNAATNFYGYRQEQLQSMHIWQINTLPKEDIELKIKSAFNEHRKPFVFEHRLSNGSIRAVEAHSTPIKFERQELLFSIVQDITGKIESDNALKASERKYRILADNTFDWEFWIDQTGNFAYSSPSCERITGYNPEDFAANPELFLNIIHPDDKHILDSHLQKADFAREPGEAEFRIIRPDGQLRWLHHICKPIFIDNEFTGIRGSNRDITKRKETEILLLENEEKFQKLFESSPILLAISDIETGRYIEVNYAFSNTLGYTKDELIGKTSIELGILEASVRTELINIMKKEGEVRDFETPVKKKNGEHRIGSLSAKIINIQRKSFLLSTFVDLTERKNAEYTIRMMADMLDEAPNSITVHDTDGNFLYANEHTFSMHGYEKQEFMAMNLHDVDVPASEALIKERMLQIEKNGEASFEVMHFKKDGTVFPLEVFGKKVIWAGKPALLSIARDITERKQAENELQRYRDNLEELVEERTSELHEAQDMLISAERLAVLGEFAGSVAHEIRNPLASIGASAYLFKHRAAKDNSAIDLKPVEDIEDEVKRCADIIDSITRLSKNDDPNKSRFDLCELLDYVLDEKPVPANIRLNLHIPAEPLFIDADREHIRICLKNLVTNAVQAMLDSGDLTINMEEIYADGNHAIKISVSDTGVGIKEETLEHIFDPLFSTKSFGMGFGLSIVKMIVDKHNGNISVESEEGKGTTFTIDLPFE